MEPAAKSDARGEDVQSDTRPSTKTGQEMQGDSQADTRPSTETGQDMQGDSQPQVRLVGCLQWLKWRWTQGNDVPGPKIFKLQRSGAQQLSFRAFRNAWGPHEVKINVNVRII